MTGSEIEQHELRRQWFLTLFSEAERFGVEQVSDDELILANRMLSRGESAQHAAAFLWRDQWPF